MNRLFFAMGLALLVVLAIIGQRRAVVSDLGFEASGQPGSWRVEGDPRTVEAAEDRLRVAARDGNVWIVSDEPVDADEVRWVRVRMRFEPDGADPTSATERTYESIHHRLSFAWVPADQAEFTLEALRFIDVAYDGRFHTYDLPLGNHALWSGSVSAVRIDPLDVLTPPGTLEITQVAFLAHRPTRLGSPLAILGCLGLWWGALLAARAARNSGNARARIGALALTTTALLASLVALGELALNLIGFEHAFPDTLVRVVFEEVEAPGYDALFRYDPETLYINREGVQYRPGERINELGLRGPVVPRTRDRRTLRVACFGDSTTFGLGVGLADSYPEQLRALLERRIESVRAGGGSPPFDRVEVINAGVIAYSIAQSWRLFESRIADFDADIVTLALSNMNDYLPSTVSDPERLELAASTPAWRFETRQWLVPRWKLFQLMTRWRDAADPQPTAGSTALRPRVNGEQYDGYLARFLEHSSEKGAELILVSFPRHPLTESRFPALLEYSDRMQRFALRQGVPFVDTRARLSGVPDFPARFFDKVHLDPAGNAAVAASIAEAVWAESMPAAGD